MDGNAPFKALALIFATLVVLFAFAWYYVVKFDSKTGMHPKHLARRSLVSKDDRQDVYGYGDLVDSFWLSLLVLSTGGHDDSLPAIFSVRIVYFGGILIGLVIFAILVGFITDAVVNFMDGLAKGKSKVIMNGHTLVLGWNEATIRLVCQLAFLRRQYLMSNETWAKRLMPWTVVPPSTPCAAADIVILAYGKEKEEMDALLETALSERGIDPRRTRVGRNIICRVGDPTDVHDLLKVGAQSATAIVTMMTEDDKAEEDLSEGAIANGSTLRVLLALRHVLLANKGLMAIRNIVMQLSAPSTYIDAACFRNEREAVVVYPLDLSVFLNSLMFSCGATPRLAKTILELVNFDGFSIRRRKSTLLVPGGVVGLTFREAMNRVDNAVLIGVCDADEANRPGDGLVPDPERKIGPNDLIIFVAVSSLPDELEDGPAKVARDDAAARKLEPADPDVAARTYRKNLLICGWRPIWTDDPKRLVSRLEQLTGDLEAGSTLTFVNRVPPELFGELLGACGFAAVGGDVAGQDPAFSAIHREAGGGTWLTPVKVTPVRESGGIVVRHWPGDACSDAVLGPLLRTVDFDVAIVLGTQGRAAGAPLPPRSCDTRVLNILLLMRDIQKQKGRDAKTLQVITENQQDSTALLALPPLGGGAATNRADFINTQAIYARALAHTLAYPAIAHAVGELFADAAGSASVDLVWATAFVPVGAPVTFGAVQQRVMLGLEDTLFEKEHPGGQTSAICIGFLDGDTDKLTFAPSVDSTTAYKANDRLVLVTRDVPPPEAP